MSVRTIVVCEAQVPFVHGEVAVILQFADELTDVDLGPAVHEWHLRFANDDGAHTHPSLVIGC
jgi:hypothetical protein